MSLIKLCAYEHLWPPPASAASCAAPSPGLRDAAGPSPVLCAAPVGAAPALASAQVSPPAAGPCMVSQRHTQNTFHSASSRFGHWPHWDQSADVWPAVPFVAEQQLPMEVLVTGSLGWGTVQFPGLSTLVIKVCRGMSGQCQVTDGGLCEIWDSSCHQCQCYNSNGKFRFWQNGIISLVVFKQEFEK